MTQDYIVSRDAELIETEIDGDMVALDVERGTCFGFNATASRIWALIERPTPMAELVEALGAEFEVAPEECARDVTALLHTLEEQKLVKLQPAG